MLQRLQFRNTWLAIRHLRTTSSRSVRGQKSSTDSSDFNEDSKDDQKSDSKDDESFKFTGKKLRFWDLSREMTADFLQEAVKGANPIEMNKGAQRANDLMNETMEKVIASETKRFKSVAALRRAMMSERCQKAIMESLEQLKGENRDQDIGIQIVRKHVPSIQAINDRMFDFMNPLFLSFFGLGMGIAVYFLMRTNNQRQEEDPFTNFTSQQRQLESDMARQRAWQRGKQMAKADALYNGPADVATSLNADPWSFLPINTPAQPPAYGEAPRDAWTGVPSANFADPNFVGYAGNDRRRFGRREGSQSSF